MVAGFSHLAILALWEQSRAADIDALNSTAAVLAACGLIELQVGLGGRRRLVVLATGLAVGATLYLKGPSGFTVVAGALIGPAWMNRNGRWLLKSGPWAALLIGNALFGVYALAVLFWSLKTQHAMPDTSGFAEAADKSNVFRRPVRLLQALALPPTLFAYALPVSLSLPFALHPSVWNSTDDAFRTRVRALVGTLAVGSLTAVLTGMINPRYAYVLLPMLCPLAGAVAVAWRREMLPKSVSVLWEQATAAAAIILLVVCVAVAAVAWRKTDHKPLLAVSVAAAAITAGLTLRWMAGRHWRAAAAGLVTLMVMTALPLDVYNNLDRARRSAFPAAQRLERAVGAGTLVTAGLLPVDHPELFYYAHVRVEAHMKQFAGPVDLPTSRWILLDDAEYPAWKAAVPDRLSHETEVWPEHKSGFLAWYTAPGGPTDPPAK